MRKITNSIKDYFELNQARKNTHWRLVDGKWMFEHNGMWIDGESFDFLYPKYDYKPNNYKGDNPGKTYA